MPPQVLKDHLSIFGIGLQLCVFRRFGQVRGTEDVAFDSRLVELIAQAETEPGRLVRKDDSGCPVFLRQVAETANHPPPPRRIVRVGLLLWFLSAGGKSD